MTAPENWTEQQKKDLETFKGYNVGPLKLLINNKTTSDDKKVVLQFILDNQEAKPTKTAKVKAEKAPKEPKVKAEKPAKTPKEPKEPKVAKNPRITDDRDDFAFEEGATVKFPEGRGDDAPIVEGVIESRFEKGGVRRYYIKKDGVRHMKRQSTLLKANAAPVA